MLPVKYMQKVLLFRKPLEAFDDGHRFMPTLLHRLKSSLSTALFHFYPLSGRLASVTNDHPPSISVYVDYVNSPGAKFSHAALDLTISDILSPLDVPSVVQSLFDLDVVRATNYDGHTLPLLSIQVTELLDGICIASCFNHSIGDGTSYWNFFEMWSEIFQSTPSDGDRIISISRPPILKRWFPEGYDPIINLPFTRSANQLIKKFEAPGLRERVFHFSQESIAKLKAKANTEGTTKDKEISISSFQSLCGLVWRSITRARRVPQDQITVCAMLANNRARLEPPISEDYFGNVVSMLSAIAKAGELVEGEGGFGYAAWKLHETVAKNTAEKIKEEVEKWFECPSTALVGIQENKFVLMTSSPRFKVYKHEFGMGKAVGIRGGYKFDGHVISYPGYEGGGSIDLDITLLPHVMANLESDSEFMDAVSLSSQPHN